MIFVARRSDRRNERHWHLAIAAAAAAVGRPTLHSAGEREQGLAHVAQRYRRRPPRAHRDAQTRRYRTGYRFGSGRVLAVVRPDTLLEQWRTLGACVAARAIIITQASNTGLTRLDARWQRLRPRCCHRQHDAHPACASGEGRESGRLHRRHDARSTRTHVEAAGTRAAFGDRFVVHRRIGAGRHQQQLGRLARASRTSLYGDGAVRSRRCIGRAVPRESSGHRTRRHARRDFVARRNRHVHRCRCP